MEKEKKKVNNSHTRVGQCQIAESPRGNTAHHLLGRAKFFTGNLELFGDTEFRLFLEFRNQVACLQLYTEGE
jgi:hypothetical protein